MDPEMMDYETPPTFTSCQCASKCYCIGIDAGSTYSAISINQMPTCNRLDDHETPILLINNPQKFPTRLAGPAKVTFHTGFDEFRLLEHGDSASEDEKELILFKLLLDDTKRTFTASVSEAVEKCREYVNAEKPDAEKLAAEKLNAVYAATLLRKARQHIGQVEWTSPNVRKDVVLTHSSFLGEPSQAFLDQIKAMLAIDETKHNFEFHTLTEHEAALRYSLYQERGILWDLHDMHNSLIVVDCGGVTIDGALYFCSTNPGDASAKESYSDLGGGLFMDMAVENLVDEQVERLSADAEQPANYDAEDLRLLQKSAMDTWHVSIKHDYQPELFEGYTFGQEGVCAVTLDPDDIQEVFDQVVTSIKKAVDDLWDKSRNLKRRPQHLFLTGGVLRNDYVAQQIERRVLETYPVDGPKVIFRKEVKRSRNARSMPRSDTSVYGWEAVAVGASLRQVPNYILARYAAGEQ